MRALLILTLIGLLLPRMGAALAGVAGFETVVICRGDAMVAVTLGPDGAPVETEVADLPPCVAPPLPGTTRGAVVPVWRPAWIVAPAPLPHAATPSPAPHLRPPGRAPPVVA